MSAYSACCEDDDDDERWRNEIEGNHLKEEEEESTAESEEVDQLLSSYHHRASKNPPAKKRASIRRIDAPDSPTTPPPTTTTNKEMLSRDEASASASAGVVVVSIEHYDDCEQEQKHLQEQETAVRPSALRDESRLQQTESSSSSCSSTTLLRDLLPHLAESNTTNNHHPSSVVTTTSCSPMSPRKGTNTTNTTLLSKTYTEPTSLSGLLRQMSNRLFSHYHPPKVAIRHSKISPTASLHSKLDDCCNNAGDGASSRATLATTTTTTTVAPPNVVDSVSLESEEDTNNDGGGGGGWSAPPSASDSPTAIPPPAAGQQQRKQQKRPPPLMRTTQLCKRCPHCKKTCLLRSTTENPTSTNGSREASPSLSNHCSCRICMVLESVQSALSSPSSATDQSSADGDVVEVTRRNTRMPVSSTWSTFSNEEAACVGDGGGSMEGLLAPTRNASLDCGGAGGGGSALELGVFCGECNGRNGRMGKKIQQDLERANSNEIVSYDCTDHQNNKAPQQQQQQLKSREQGIQVNSSSMISIATASSFGGPVCRICHSPGDKLEPLISPCRCLGTLKYVHASCLLHWLDISSRKLRRPPHCELCGYRYQRHKTVKLRRIQWPSCTRRDKICHFLFMLSILVMVACAAVTIVCFKADRSQPRTPDDTSVLKKATGGNVATVGAGGGGNNQQQQVELSGQEVVTLICGILFFCAFFVAMYVQVKAQTTVYKLCVRFWTMNQEWHVDEYRREQDAEYWRQRQEQQLLQQQRRRAASAQLSNNSAIASTTAAASAAAGGGGPTVHHTPVILHQERSSHRSLSLSSQPASTSSFRVAVLNGFD